jgi:hypothetical protein
MADFTPVKRMNFFTGFFTTADDWTEGQVYHLDKRSLHNRGLHTPGIIRGEGDELSVERTTGLNLTVLSGAALDAEGNLICLDGSYPLRIDPPDSAVEWFYVAISCEDRLDSYVENVENPEYSGHTRVAEVPIIEVLTEAPADRLELARIRLDHGARGVSIAEINRDHVMWAGSVGIAEPSLSPDDLEALTLAMQNTRENFAALASRFPVPSAVDVRQAALTVHMLAETGNLRQEHVPVLLRIIGEVEQDVTHEFGAAEIYSAVTESTEFEAYGQAVDALLEGESRLAEQELVARRALELSQVVLPHELPPPVADTGFGSGTATITTSGDEATVTLDAGDSRAFDGREIVRYRWRKTG